MIVLTPSFIRRPVLGRVTPIEEGYTVVSGQIFGCNYLPHPMRPKVRSTTRFITGYTLDSSARDMEQVSRGNTGSDG